MDYRAFAELWEAGWNSHDLGRITSHYRDDIVFRSQKALDLVGTGELHGLPALRAYWTLALNRQPDLKFQIRDVFSGFEMCVISYTNRKGVLAAETLYFDANQKVYLAAACHSA